VLIGSLATARFSSTDPYLGTSTDPASHTHRCPIMAPSKRVKKTAEEPLGRPSRLLNLNKSPQAQKLL
jgi:hypothetical protein